MLAVLVYALVVPSLLAAMGLWLLRRERKTRAELDQLRRDAAAGLQAERLRAAAEERTRLLADLHDDIGAKLLTLIHTLDNPDHADLARAVMQDFRDVVSRTNQDACSLRQALGQIREETECRLEAVGSVLEWQQDEALPDPALDEAQVLHLFRIAREAVTNALRHAQATRLRVRIREIAGHLILDVTDDGPGFVPESAHAGRGTVSMRQRAHELSGTIDWEPGTRGGTKVVLEFPLPKPVVSPD
jgi:signal transduction histidine kinase